MAGQFRVKCVANGVSTERLVEEPQEIRKLLSWWWERAKTKDKFVVTCELPT